MSEVEVEFKITATIDDEEQIEQYDSLSMREQLRIDELVKEHINSMLPSNEIEDIGGLTWQIEVDVS